MADTYISADLGQLTDFSAISVTNVESYQKPYLVASDNREARFDPRDVVPVFEVPLIERMQVRYRKVLERLVEIQHHPSLLMRECETIIDATGLGQAVFEMAEEMGLEVTGIVITGGHEAHFKDGKYYVPRKELIGAVIVGVQERRIRVANLGEISDITKDELRNLRLKQKPLSASEAIEPDQASQHDDIVLSLGMGIWRAMQEHQTEMVYLDRLEDDNSAQIGGGSDYDIANWGLKV